MTPVESLTQVRSGLSPLEFELANDVERPEEPVLTKRASSLDSLLP